MENTIQIEHEPKHNWLIGKIKKYPIIALAIGFISLRQLVAVFTLYFADKNLFIETYVLNIGFWIICIPVIYFLLWLLVVYVLTKFPREKLRQKFSKHPIATIASFILFVVIWLYLMKYNSGGNGLEVVAGCILFVFLWWLLICWVSGKILKKQRLQWYWYQKTIEKIFIFLPIFYKVIFILALAITSGLAMFTVAIWIIEGVFHIFYLVIWSVGIVGLVIAIISRGDK